MEKCSTWNDDGNLKCQRCQANPMKYGDGGRNDACYDKNYQRTSRRRGHSYDDTSKGSNRNDSSEHCHPTIAANDSAHTVDDSNVADLDEFGRVRSLQPKKIRWPPCFETHGSA